MTAIDQPPTLREYVQALPERLSGDERTCIVEQAIVLLDQLYVHLPLKRAMFGVDPVQRLRRLRQRLGTMSEYRFHRQVLDIFTDLRDLHTIYKLPSSYRGRGAFLPFLVEAFYEGGQRRFLVSKVCGTLDHRHFREGVLLTHWNGSPIQRAVERNADDQAGNNDAARHARGLQAFTLRPLGSNPVPDEDWVVVTYVGLDGREREIRLPWRVCARSPFEDDRVDDDAAAVASGLDIPAETMRRLAKELFAEPAMEAERAADSLWDGSGGSARSPARAATEAFELRSTLPDNFSFRTLDTAHGPMGYVRIWTFNDSCGHRRPVQTFVEQFVDELVRILELLPTTGLILDIRGNPGGRIPAAEHLLELLTPRPIDPARFHVRNTALMHTLCSRAPASIELLEVSRSVERAIETGAVYSDGRPFLPFSRRYNVMGQRWFGPTVLIVDALSYSASDIFAAGFQDHGIGPVLGADDLTGAGGANAWDHTTLTRFLGRAADSPMRPLPRGASFSVAIRRSTRVGANAGVPLEDLGVRPDVVHRMTRADVLHRNVDLLSRAAQLISAQPRRALSIAVSRRPDRGIDLRVESQGIDRLDVYTDTRPVDSVDVSTATVRMSVPAERVGQELELRGFSGHTLVARRRVDAQLGREPRAPRETLVFEEHSEVLAEWKRRDLHGRTLITLDDHLDLHRVEPATLEAMRRCRSPEQLARFHRPSALSVDALGYGIEDFLYPAHRLGMISRIVWVNRTRPDLAKLRRRLCVQHGVTAEELAGLRAEGSVLEGRLLGVPLQICTLADLPALDLPADSLVDIDIDYFLSFDDDRPWTSPHDVFEGLQRLGLEPPLVTICRSVTSGYVPLRRRYLADFLAALWSGRAEEAAHFRRLLALDARLDRKEQRRVTRALEAELAAFPRCAATLAMLARSDDTKAHEHRKRAAQLCPAYAPDALRDACLLLVRASEPTPTMLGVLARRVDSEEPTRRAWLHAALGLLYAKIGDTRAAMRHHHGCRLAARRHPGLCMVLGTRLLKEGRPDLARSLLEYAMKDPRIVGRAATLLGHLLLEQGRPTEAARALEVASTACPAWERPARMLAQLRAREHRPSTTARSRRNFPPARRP